MKIQSEIIHTYKQTHTLTEGNRGRMNKREGRKKKERKKKREGGKKGKKEGREGVRYLCEW